MAKYMRRGKSKIHFLPAVANKAAPTRLEIDAGTNISKWQAISGFQIRNQPIDTPDGDTAYTTNIPGEDRSEASSLTYHDDDASTTTRTALAKGTSGFVVLMPYGDVAAKRCEVWPIRSSGVNDQWTADNESAKFVVDFSVPDTPEQNAVIPA